MSFVFEELCPKARFSKQFVYIDYVQFYHGFGKLWVLYSKIDVNIAYIYAKYSVYVKFRTLSVLL